MARKKKNAQDETLVIPLDLDDEIEKYEQQAAQAAQVGRVDLKQLKEMSISQLSSAAKGLGVENPAELRDVFLVLRFLKEDGAWRFDNNRIVRYSIVLN